MTTKDETADALREALGPQAKIIGDGPDGFMPVGVVVGQCVYIRQAGSLIVLDSADLPDFLAALSDRAAERTMRTDDEVTEILDGVARQMGRVFEGMERKLAKAEGERDAAWEALRPFAARQTVEEMLNDPQPDDWLEASVERRIEMMGERKRKRDGEILAARAALPAERQSDGGGEVVKQYLTTERGAVGESE